MWPVILAIASTVALLCSMGFFMMGSLPLLILKHDTPLDARFIRGLFNLHYRAVMVTATVAALAYGMAGKPAFSAGMAAIALLGFGLHRTIVGRMDALRGTMTPSDAPGISRFRRLHVSGMLLNVLQLGAVAIGLTQLAL